MIRKTFRQYQDEKGKIARQVEVKTISVSDLIDHMRVNQKGMDGYSQPMRAGYDMAIIDMFEYLKEQQRNANATT